MKRWIRITPQNLDRQDVGYCIKTRNLEQSWTKKVGLLVAPLVIMLFGTSIPANAVLVIVTDPLFETHLRASPSELDPTGRTASNMTGVTLDLEGNNATALDFQNGGTVELIGRVGTSFPTLYTQHIDITLSGPANQWEAHAGFTLIAQGTDSGARLCSDQVIPSCTDPISPGQSAALHVNLFDAAGVPAEREPTANPQNPDPPPSTTVSIVESRPMPEPGSLVLLSTGLLGLFWMRRRLFRA